jgi:hypothetical protein
LIALLLISTGILIIGMAGSLALMLRTGEARVAFLSLLFALLGVRQGIELWSAWGAPPVLSFDMAGVAEASVLAACVAGVISLAALWQSLFERDRAETLHWNSMEAVRILGEVAARPNLTLDERLDELLKIGCERYDLEVGLVSRLDDERKEVIGFRAPDGFPLSKSATLLVADSCCTRTLASERPIALERIDGVGGSRGDSEELGFRAYLGVAVRVFGKPVGTLSFGSREPRKHRFTATDKDLLNLMSQWVGGELERRFVAEEREVFAEHQRELENDERPAIRRHEARAARSVDVNSAIQRSEKSLRNRVGSGVALDLHLATSLIQATHLPVAIGSIVESIVAQAVSALSGAGLITIETANLELANRDPDVVPAIAPNHYVTASVTATGSRIEADCFANAFDPPAEESHRGSIWDLQSDLPLATIYRLLQRSGGDLSVEIEPGRSCTFTVFLPAADSQPERPRPAEGTTQPLRLN